jgi:hypothetical protein
MPKASDEDHQLAESRGVADFCHALQRLVDEGGFGDNVHIVDWEELKVCD